MKNHQGGRSRAMKRAGAAAFLTAAVMAITACGGGDNTPSAEPEGDAPASLGTVRVIQSISHDLTQGGVEIAQILDLYPDGLEVEIITGTAVAQALATGDVDMGVASPTRVTGAVLEGLEATIVAPTLDVWDQYVVASLSLGVDSIQEMEGVRWGVSTFGSAGDYSVRKVADTLGWADPDIVTMGDIAGLLAGLENGTIDAFMWGSFAPFEMEAQGHGVIVGSAQEVIGPMPLNIIAVRNDFLASNPAEVKAFCYGVLAANRAMQDDPAATQKIFEGWGIPTEVVIPAMEAGLPLLSTSSLITDEQLENIVDATRLTVSGAENFDLDQMRAMYRNCDEL